MSEVRKNAADQVPASIGRYQINGLLGYGAMGAVYKAFDPLIKRALAIKTVRLDIPRASPQYRAFIDRFQHEAQISGTLNHPGIVTLFDLGEDNGDPFFAMEFVDGRTIADVLAGGTRFKPERVIGLVSQIASALDYAHSRGVVHRDVKPANLILYDGDKVKITDFGIAKLQDADITHAGALLGTPSYMSPEQAMGEKLDGRSDIFSLGVVAFEMLSGQQPFPGPNVTSILYKLVHTDPIEPPGLELLGLVPNKWREVFQKVLAKKPESRYQTASAFVQDLEYCLGSWFTGLGNDDTVTLQVMEDAAVVGAALGDVPTVSIARPPVPVVPQQSASAPAPAENPLEETFVIVPPEAPPDLEAALSTQPMPSLSGEAQQSPIPAAAAVRVRQLRPGIPMPLVLGGAAAVLVVLLGLTAWALRPPSPAPVVAAPAAATAPVTLSSPKAPPTREASATPATLATPRPAPRPRPAATTGTADVLSTPVGAVVAVDGRPAGQTPLRGLKLQPGKRLIDVSLAGYESWTSSLEVVAGESGRVDVKLLPRPAAPATPEPVDTARVYPNDASQVDTPARKLSGMSPSYPSGRAPRLRSGQRVSVMVRFVVSERGDVSEVAVVESGGDVVDDVVVAAIKAWKYEPAIKHGVKVKVETSFRQTFLGA